MSGCAGRYLRGRLVLTVAACGLCAGATAVAGPLVPPPGPIGPTMKTLTEVEPRIAVNAVNTPGDSGACYIISQPGSYYLTENITCNKYLGIRIVAADVTLDLNGFRVMGVAGVSEWGITVDDESGGVRNVTVRNGTVTGAFSQGGVTLNAQASRVEKITVRDVPDYGISTSWASTITGCTVEKCTIGIAATRSIVSDCLVSECSNSGMSVVRTHVRGCSVQRCGNHGIVAQVDAVVENCHLLDNGTGSGAGIYVLNSGTRLEGNTIAGSYNGIYLASGSADNLVMRNTVRKGGGIAGIVAQGQTPNVFPNNHVAQVIADPASPFAATNPMANIQY